MCMDIDFSHLEDSPSKRGAMNVRFESKADMCSAIGHVRSTPESDAMRSFETTSILENLMKWPRHLFPANRVYTGHMATERVARARVRLFLVENCLR